MPTIYEPSSLSHHHHVHCKGCGRVFDVEGCPGKLLGMNLPGFSVESHDVIFYGRCQSCN
jgi:Fur family ferric uptake transcriptional regulator